jgi:phosphonatase-like hydrolase
MNKIKLIVFDIAGTTVKDNGEIADAFANALKEFGYNVPTTKINPLMGYKKPQAIRMMVEEYESEKQMITDEYISAIHDRFLQLMIEHYKTTKEIVPLPNVLEVFSFVKNKGVKIGLDTGFSSDITEVIIDRLGWLKDGVVDYAVSSNEVPAGRPQPYMIQKMMQESGIANTQQVVKIGDTEVDVQEGKNAGCLYSIAVTTGAFTREELLPYEPSFIIDNMQELVPIIEPLV